MNDQNPPPGPIMLGPLTAEEWASLFLPDGDERNPLPPCCGNISDVRDALADVMRIGGDPETGWLRIAPLWDHVEACFDPEYVRANLVLRKLYDAYVAGRDLPDDNAEMWEKFLAKTRADVQKYLNVLDSPDSPFDLDTEAGRMHALVRMAGTFVAHVVDDAERRDAAGQLADKLGMDRARVYFTVDVLRQQRGLPYRATAATAVAL